MTKPTHVQRVQIRFVSAGTEATPPPGDPRIWSALASGLGDLNCHRSTLIQFEWYKTSAQKLPDISVWRKILCFQGLHVVANPEDIKSITLQIRRKGIEADPLVTMTREWLERKGYELADTIFLTRQFQFVQNSDILYQALEKLLSLGSKSGFFHPASEEARVLKEGSEIHWPLSEQALKTPESYLAAFGKSLEESASWSPLRQTLHLIEHRPRTKALARSVDNPLRDLFWTQNEESAEREEPIESGPLSFIGGFPRHADPMASLERFRRKCEVVASQYDRSVGIVSIRDQGTTGLAFDVWSPLVLNNKYLPARPSPAHRLFMIGPWDSRNATVERRIEFFLDHHFKDLYPHSEFLSGDQDWVAYLATVIFEEKGWIMDTEGGPRLFHGNHTRTRFHRVGFFWGTDADEMLLAPARSLGVPLTHCGQNHDKATFVLRDREATVFELPMDELLKAMLAQREVRREARWDYPDEKAPAYGFDKATLFPDQYLLKVTAWDKKNSEWGAQSNLIYAGDKFRGVLTRRASCTPLPCLRWYDGQSLWAESVGAKEGWADIDPRAAGIASVDTALRHLVAIGAPPDQGGTGDIWMPEPEGVEGESSAHLWAAYFMALEGAAAATKGFGFKIRSLNGGGVAYPKQKQEILIHLRTKCDPMAQTTVQGFRMVGEVLYAIGPRPAFVDAGSKMLPYVRVFSNHTFRLNPDAQLNLYKMIYDSIQKGVITSIRPIGDGGVAEALGEMALWSGIGCQVRPTIPTIEIFSGSPGRFVVGILPSSQKAFEQQVPSELLTHLGTVGGEKILGLPLSRLKESRGEIIDTDFKTEGKK